MADRPPPSRLSVVERGGRLVVIDRVTGGVPPTAAERMAAHDAQMGHEPNRPVIREVTAAPVAPAARRATMDRPAGVVATAQSTAAKAAGKNRIAAALAERTKQPWGETAAETPSAPAPEVPARIASRPEPLARGSSQTIVTGKWWDSKGPRTLNLGPKGQAKLRSGFVTLFFGLLAAAVVLLFIAPLALFAAAFVLFRFGGTVLGPMGSKIVDKALAERG